MKESLLFLISFKIQFYIFKDFIKKISRYKSFNIVIMVKTEDIKKEIGSFFSNCSIEIGFSREALYKLSPNLIICQDLWFDNKVEILKSARKKNIPILMYDHGSLVFGSYFSLEGDEFLANYRSDISLCSHAVCWGMVGKTCWLQYAVTKDKLFAIGAPQYDYLYQDIFCSDSSNVYKSLNISANKKIILFFATISHPAINEEWHNRELSILHELEEFVGKNKDYQLVVKPHPASIIYHKEAFPYSDKTIIVANFFEDAWKNAIKIDINELCSVSHLVISSASSVLISPLILNIPIIHIEINRPVSNAFSRLGADQFFNLKEGDSIENTIDMISLNFHKYKKDNYSKLAASLNYNNDGYASKRLIALIENILQDQKNGTVFYKPEEQELLELIAEYQEFPYPYQNIVKFYALKNNFHEAFKWLEVYVVKFQQAIPLVKMMLDIYFSQDRSPQQIKDSLTSFYKRDLLLSPYILKLAYALFQCKEYDLAHQMVKKVECMLISEADINTSISYDLALYYLFSNENIERAILLLESSLSHNALVPKKYQIYYRLAEAYNERKLYSKTVEALKECIKLCPEHQAAKDLLKRMSCYET